MDLRKRSNLALVLIQEKDSGEAEVEKIKWIPKILRSSNQLNRWLIGWKQKKGVIIDFKFSGLKTRMDNVPFSKRENLRGKKGTLFAGIMRSDLESDVSVEYLPSVIKGAGGYESCF